jgi:hypothetical protein
VLEMLDHDQLATQAQAGAGRRGKDEGGEEDVKEEGTSPADQHPVEQEEKESHVIEDLGDRPINQIPEQQHLQTPVESQEERASGLGKTPAPASPSPPLTQPPPPPSFLRQTLTLQEEEAVEQDSITDLARSVAIRQSEVAHVTALIAQESAAVAQETHERALDAASAGAEMDRAFSGAVVVVVEERWGGCGR